MPLPILRIAKQKANAIDPRLVGEEIAGLDQIRGDAIKRMRPIGPIPVDSKKESLEKKERKTR